MAGKVVKVEKTRININLPSDLVAWIEAEATKQGFTFTTMLQLICLDYKKQQEAMLCMDKLQALEALCRRNGYTVNADDLPL